ncbi:hypothetical protein E1B28_008385 [Marasmius oreades]|uniref:Uncharacterized protein n=1 Tax=Marasmius oreades TaxID=181124 RepID=A0A9P7US27_9AGAR|nr:uncharacterized protein E1B28_008385 [Marasmius oreades]KAG7091998.1 hypothetical protein E1B28_008385 [Marasmius oreades]
MVFLRTWLLSATVEFRPLLMSATIPLELEHARCHRSSKNCPDPRHYTTVWAQTHLSRDTEMAPSVSTTRFGSPLWDYDISLNVMCIMQKYQSQNLYYRTPKHSLPIHNLDDIPDENVLSKATLRDMQITFRWIVSQPSG